ncbi:P-loop containing nucleoside triphosphate hydrolase protein [Lobosporangium transversale]|uniref:p-loop containing nucleoside triphosphate hydrolase protein n=1 Tax=Lobosporangium transversale TaxID=64571 RepID=A0A1Y2GHC4_9FUNG|nr:P-loop containing nucleoside triphosphate hydrolase protein [Lobosporangium transversale]ORZ07533.1 P-loop containing nucleoside triphosphate hydrolase protein [Lobosporangium transversale]|eukprot:XP_021878040.1 P-loop containing nucleoside triphosphate hydrolase protein [Lobosporangium transversale]
MDLLYDTQKLRILHEKDQKINLRKGTIDTFEEYGYESVDLYTERLVDMCSYEFQIEAAKALFGKIPDDHDIRQLKRVKNNAVRGPIDDELNEDDGKPNGDSGEVDGPDAEDWVLTGEPEMYNYKDIVIAAITKSFGDETDPERYIGYVSHISKIPQSGLRRYFFTFDAQISSSQDIDVLMWTIGNLTSYERVVNSLSDKDAMRSIPKLFLKAPVTDISPLTDDTVDIPDGVPESMNQSQKVAISRAIQEDGDKVVLIQGPPGCGKSTTIAEMIHLLTSHDRGNTGMQVLACAQTNVAVADLAFKYVTTKKPANFKCVMDMRPPKITDSRKRAVLEPFTITARYHQVVNAVLHTIIRVFGRTPTACHGSTTRNEVRSIVASDFRKCMESGLIKLLPPKACKLLMSMEAAISDSALPSTDLTQVKRLVSGMRNELELFFEPVELESLLELCSVDQHTGSSPRSKTIPIYGWVKQALLDEASVVFCTINIGISLTFKRRLERLAYIVVDEAAQALEPDVAALMCVDSYFRRLILVGDPKQLRGYCASNRGKREMMDRSLMERLQTYRLCHSTLLDVQYRMHQDICNFVSRTFYDNRLTSDASIQSRRAVTALAPIMHVMFLGSQMAQSTITTTSVVNIDEARYIVAHVFKVLLQSRQNQVLLTNTVTKSISYAAVTKNTEKVETRQPVEVAKITIGIICIYKAQANVIRCLVEKSQNAYKGFGAEIVVNTIDSFQGQECDIIYVALTRTTQINTFMDNANRVNVAISRARHHLIVVGDAKLSLAAKQDAPSSYWHSLCMGRRSMVIEPKYIRSMPQYDGPERVTVMKAAVIQAAPATIKEIIAKGLAATTPIWTIHYERLTIDPKTPQGIHILEYVVQALASGDFDTGNGGRTTRPLFGKKQKGASLFFVTTVCGVVCLAWTVRVHGQRQAIELLGIGDKTFVEKTAWPLLRRDIEGQPEWKLFASMSLWSSGISVDLSKDMPKSTSLLYVPADIEIPVDDALADVPENGHLLIDHDHIKAMSFMRSSPTMVLGGGGTGKTECMLDMIEQQLDMDTDLGNVQLYLGATDSLANWSSMRLLKRENITEQGFKMVSFTSLPSLLSKLYMSNSTIRGKLFVDRDIFRSEYMDAMPAMVRSIGADELYDAIHARMDIETENGISSLRPEYKTAHKVYELVKTSRGHFDAYDLHALVEQDPQRLVAMASKIARIYLDEVQDISWTMWSVIEVMLSARTSSVVCAGDFTQRLTPGISVNGIKSLIYKHLPKSMETIRFKTNYRSDPSIISLANRIQSYTHMREHAMEPSLYPQESSNSVTLVEIQDIEHENVADVLRYIGVPSNNYRAAIVTSSSWAHRLRETLGKSHNVFSAYECKGLEFDLVVCWDLFNPSMDVKTSTLRRNMGAATLDKGNIEEDENFEIYLNHLYVTVTRARKHLIMVVPSCDRSSIMVKALGISDMVHYSEVRERGPLPEIIIPIDELSVSDDLRMAIVMRERGLLQQALNVFEQYGDAAQAGFTRALIHRNEHRLRGEDHEIQLCISECYGVIEVLQQSTDSVLKIEDVKLFLTQALVADKQYAEACLLYKELEMEDELVACLIEAVESKSGDVVRLRYLISEKAVAIWEHFKDNKRYARFVVALMLVFKSSTVDLIQSMITHIPSKAGLTMLHNSLIEADKSVSPIWEVFRRRKWLQVGSGSEESEELTFLEWSSLRRLDGQHSNEDLVYIISTGCLPESQSSIACLFVGPRNNKTTKTLSLNIQSGAMLKACRSLEIPLKHVSTKMRELSCPLTDFMALHSQISGEESRMYLLAEAYKTHKLKMRGSEHQLTLFRWCAKMSGGTNIIDMICTMLKEDRDMLLAIYSPDNTLNVTQKALLQVLNERDI